MEVSIAEVGAAWQNGYGGLMRMIKEEGWTYWSRDAYCKERGKVRSQ